MISLYKKHNAAMKHRTNKTVRPTLPRYAVLPQSSSANYS